ncbi:MAG: hypothetical protein DHS20C16_23920 [Phycisphaerae bacterium]|nr:MAG: hypothetical protein DHS20C16_23920 [Phycisphaerae bacterium]
MGRLLAFLGKQRLDDGLSFEVVVALDGKGSTPAKLEESLTLADGRVADVRCLPLERVGISAAKNAAVAAARGDVLLFVNDDIEPWPDFVQRHADAHAAGHEVVLGYSPWVIYPDQTIFDEMIARTRMVFFYSDLKRGKSYGFRHAWNLNLSVARSLVEKLDGPFCESLQPVFYDDVEFAHRMIGDDERVFYASDAVALHRHRYTLASYFGREALLGVMAHSLHRVNDACFKAIFAMGLDELVSDAGRVVEHDVRDETRALATVCDLGGQAIDHPVDERLVRAMYVAHLPLKRRAFRLGLLARQAAPKRDWREYPELAHESLADDAVMGLLFDGQGQSGASGTCRRMNAPDGP